MSPIRFCCIPVIAALLAGCGATPEGSATAQSAASPPASSAASEPFAGLLLTSAPADATSVTALKAAAKPGQAVVLRGRVGGRVQPFVEGRAAMLVVDDQALQACDANPDDACGTPWDFCCVAQSDLAKGMAMVQVVGEDGRPKAADLQGLGGLAPGSRVVISGTVAEDSSEGNLVVNAAGIYPEAAPTASGGEPQQP